MPSECSATTFVSKRSGRRTCPAGWPTAALGTAAAAVRTSIIMEPWQPCCPDSTDCTQIPAEGLERGAAVSYVPVVDISADPDAVGAELNEICRAAGFFQVTGHGVPGEVAERAWTAATRFFDLPPEDKLSVARPDPDYPYGFIPLAGESLSQSIADAAPPDLKEVFNAGPPVRPGPLVRRSGRGLGLLPQPVARGAAGTPGDVDGLLRRHARSRRPHDVAVRARPGPAAWVLRRPVTGQAATRCAPPTTAARVTAPLPGSSGDGPHRSGARSRGSPWAARTGPHGRAGVSFPAAVRDHRSATCWRAGPGGRRCQDATGAGALLAMGPTTSAR